MPCRSRFLVVAVIVVTLAAAYVAGQAFARPAERATPRLNASGTQQGVTVEQQAVTQIQPIKAPSALLRARAACPNDATPVQCRSALRRAYQALAWQRKNRLAAKAKTVREITLDAIQWAAAKYHVSPAEMRAVGTCESHLWPFATNGQYAGVFQLSTRHREDPIFTHVPWQDAYAQASHVARYVAAHGWSEWQCTPYGGLRW